MRLREHLSNFPPLFEQALAAVAAEPGRAEPPKSADPALRQTLIRENHKLSAAELADLVSAYESGTSIKGLGRQFDLHEQTVRAHLVRAGVRIRPQKVLAPDQAAEIVAGYQAGASLRELAKVHGVSDGSIRNYLLRAGVTLRAARRVPRQAASDSS